MSETTTETGTNGGPVETLRRLYAAIVPASVRLRVWNARRELPRRLRELRWQLQGPPGVKRWVDQKLDPSPHSWIFILGCNNSGTTLLTELLGGHPLVRKMRTEGQRLTTAIPNSAKYGIGRVFTQRLDLFRWTEDTAVDGLERLRYDWACHFSTGPGYLMEKSPPNTLRSRWLQRHFRPSRFLVLVRHPYAVCEGVTRRTRYTIEEAAVHWAKVHEVLRDDMPRLEACLVMRYEDVCERPGDELRRLERFLALPAPFDRGLLTRNFRSHNMDGTPRTLQNLNARSLRRLTREDLDSINGHVAAEAAMFGYELM